MSRQDLSPSLSLGPTIFKFKTKFRHPSGLVLLQQRVLISVFPPIWLKPCFNCSMFCIVFVLECCEMVSFSRSSCPLVCTHLLCARRPGAGQRWSDLCFVFLFDIFDKHDTMTRNTGTHSTSHFVCPLWAKFCKSLLQRLSFRDRRGHHYPSFTEDNAEVIWTRTW